jgi:hypothetical protein
MANQPTPFDENAVRDILARAVELESKQRGALTELQVRDIARDLNIPDHVIDQALAEHLDASAAIAANRPGLPRWRKRAALMALATIGLIAIMLIFFSMALRISVPH